MQIEISNELLKALWVFYILLGVVPAYIYALDYHKKWRTSDDKMNLQTQGMWLVDLVIKFLGFLVSLFLWPLVIVEWVALWCKKQYNKTRKGAPKK